MIRYKDNSISFEKQDLERFSIESGDRNPLHMSQEYANETLYGETVVFGMLGVITLLNEYSIVTTAVHIKFNSPLFLDRRYSLFKEVRKQNTYLYLMENNSKLIVIKCMKSEINGAVLLEENEQTHIPMLSDANDPDDRDIEKGIAGEGEYYTEETNAGTFNRILQLCSYVVGMVSPGQRALFMQASIITRNNLCEMDRTRYRIKTIDYNPTLRVLENEMEIICGELVVAKCKIQAYVRARFNQAMREEYPVSSNVYKGKVVLIIGGTRGIGAEIAKRYVVEGANVIVVYHSNEDAVIKLKTQLSLFKDKIDFFKGDMSKLDSCEKLHQYIEKKYILIDRIYLCAALPSKNLELSLNTYSIFEKYVESCLRIFSYPFLQTQPLIKQNGKIVFFSSIAVIQKKEAYRLMDYIGGKMLIESIFECFFNKNLDAASYYVVRPSKMFTEMNNTPTGRLGAVEPVTVAQYLINEIEKEENGQREYRVIDINN